MAAFSSRGSLHLANTYIEQDYLKVLGKGDKERILPFGSTTKKALLRYIHTFRPEPIHEGVEQLILATDGSPLTYSGLAQAIKRLGKRTGVPRLHSHLLRHTFAVRYPINGGDIMTLRLILGHATLEVTQMYMHLAEAHVKVQHHRFSPVGRLVMKVRGRR